MDNELLQWKVSAVKLKMSINRCSSVAEFEGFIKENLTKRKSSLFL